MNQINKTEKKTSSKIISAVQRSLQIGSKMLALLLLFICSSSMAQLVNVPVSGFNNDIVANGTGTNSIAGTTYPLIGMDGARYTFEDITFKYTASSLPPVCFMPVNNTIPSSRTAGLSYILQSYSAFNSLTIDNDNTAYLTSPFAKTGSFTLMSPASYSKLYVLYESVMYISPMTVDATVTFTDSTTQLFSNNTCVNWFTPTLPTYSGMGRTSPTGIIQCGSTPNLFELQLTLNAANYGKLVKSITLTLPTTYTTGTTADKVNYFHAMAVGGLVAPLGKNELTSGNSGIALFPNPAMNQLTVVSDNNTDNQYLSLYDIAGREVKKVKLESSKETISLMDISKGVFFYKIYKGNETLSTGKLIHTDF